MGPLYNIYDYLVLDNLASEIDIAPLKIIYNNNFCWPNLCYKSTRAGRLTDKQITLLSEKIEENKINGLLLLNEEEVDNEIYEQLSKTGFKPVTKWADMVFRPADDLKQLSNSEHNVEVHEVSNEEQLKEWLLIVSGVLFRNQLLDSNMFWQGRENGKFCMFLAYEDSVPVATAMLYFDTVPCIYMVATLPAYRKKGIAKLLIQHLHNTLLLKGYNSVMLQSTREGQALYQKIGYNIIDTMILFYKNLKI